MNTDAEKTENKIVNIIMGWDGYSDVWVDFFNLMDKYWSDINMPIYFVDVDKNCPSEKATLIKCGPDMKWSSRLKYALEQINCKYVFLNIDDFMYCRKIDNNRFDDAIKNMEKYNIDYFRLTPYPHTRKNFHGIKGIKCIDKKSESGINLQPAIWNKSFLMKILGDNDLNTWGIEYEQTLRSRESEEGLFENCVADVSKIINFRHDILKGKHNLFTILYFKAKGYKINTDDRPIMNLWETLCYYTRFWGYRIVPDRFKIGARKVLRKFGVKFVNDTQYVK